MSHGLLPSLGEEGGGGVCIVVIDTVLSIYVCMNGGMDGYGVYNNDNNNSSSGSNNACGRYRGEGRW